MRARLALALALVPSVIGTAYAGVPHAFVPGGSEPWELLVIKVRRPDEPLRRTAATGR